MIVNVNLQQVSERGGADGNDGPLGDPGQKSILHRLDLWGVFVLFLFDDGAV